MSVVNSHCAQFPQSCNKTTGVTAIPPANAPTRAVLIDSNRCAKSNFVDDKEEDEDDEEEGVVNGEASFLANRGRSTVWEGGFKSDVPSTR
jgi:hypothetical protein